MNLHTLYDYAVGFVAVCSAINLILPPWERFSKWPRFQSYYQLASIFIGYWANLNFKSRLWPELSVDNQVQKAMQNGGKQNGTLGLP